MNGCNDNTIIAKEMDIPITFTADDYTTYSKEPTFILTEHVFNINCLAGVTKVLSTGGAWR